MQQIVVLSVLTKMIFPDGDLPQVGLSGIIECERSTRSLQLRQVNIDFSKPWLHVAFGKTSNDVFKKFVSLTWTVFRDLSFLVVGALLLR